MSDLATYALAAVLVVLAGVFSAMDAAVSGSSPARAAELDAEGRTGAAALRVVLADPARFVNTALLLRMACEVAAIVLVTVQLQEAFATWGAAVGVAAAVMVLTSYVVVGVAPRTLGRQHAEPLALASAVPLRALTAVLGPVTRVLIALSNAITPGTGFREGPFSTETELRELVDYAEASALIEADEHRMLSSVFELGDTTAREVMVPRDDIVFVERHRNLRQATSLFLRSGYSRMPVVGDNLDQVIGVAYLKDLARTTFADRDGDITQRVEDHMRPCSYVPDSKPVDALLREMQAARQHVAVVVDEYGGTAGLVTIEDILEEIVGEITDEFDPEEVAVEHLAHGAVRVPSRFPVDDLHEHVAVPDDAAIEDEEVDSVGGLMAKHLGLVPIPGSEVTVHGLRLIAEGTVGRRKKIHTVLVTPVERGRQPTHDTRDEPEPSAADRAEELHRA